MSNSKYADGKYRGVYYARDRWQRVWEKNKKIVIRGKKNEKTHVIEREKDL